jgi:transcriptional regulator with XRE-family HTH domain
MVDADMPKWIERGAKLRRARKAKGETLRECALRLGISVVECSNLELGKVNNLDVGKEKD